MYPKHDETPTQCEVVESNAHFDVVIFTKRPFEAISSARLRENKRIVQALKLTPKRA